MAVKNTFHQYNTHIDSKWNSQAQEQYFCVLNGVNSPVNDVNSPVYNGVSLDFGLY